MSKPQNFIEWLARVEQSTQQEKNEQLFFAIDLTLYEQIEPLLRAGATLDMPGRDTLAWSILRVQDFKVTNLLLDYGFRADHVRHDDIQFMHYEDKAAYFDLLGRLAHAGLPFRERAKAAAHAAANDRIDIVPSLLLEGEDLKTFIVEARKHDTYKKLENISDADPAMTDLYAAHFTEGLTEEGLKEKMTATGMTGYMLAVRAEKFDEVVEFYKKNPALRLSPDDMLYKDAHGLSVASLLVVRDRLPDLFAAELWIKDCDAAQKLLASLPETFRAKIDSEAVLRDIRQATLRDISKKKLNNDKKI